jgi:hypothetical protein
MWTRDNQLTHTNRSMLTSRMSARLAGLEAEAARLAVTISRLIADDPAPRSDFGLRVGLTAVY